ncbi:class I SAM-dependent methyltransferase [Burkholderia stabilis]|uniref:class I SAM-dependent methyltransferase n=1 Tax=Burkholderia stabilis TaxID=95485 RepID=UPI001589EF0C|nr:class I SAM-dependent methyltransferase [Burkholderia stabilis]
MTRDLFSALSHTYRRYRPTYGDGIFTFLAATAPSRLAAWDCACGSGQATVNLAMNFDQVVATDISEQQLALAPRLANVRYRAEPAERVSLPTGSVDLTFVGQALHWFDIPLFYDEVRRISRPKALLAVASYNLLRIEPGIDALVSHLYSDILGKYWAPERGLVETGYASIPFPFARVCAPAFQMVAQWTLPHLTGYLESWSASNAYMTECGENPVDSIRMDLARRWGHPRQVRQIIWPLTLLIGTTR